MIQWRDGVVAGLRRRWRGLIELDATVLPRTANDPATVLALAYPDLVGEPLPGDRVLLNLNAFTLGLGTGGYAFVVALPDRLPADRARSSAMASMPVLVKARYTPLQVIVTGIDGVNPAAGSVAAGTVAGSPVAGNSVSAGPFAAEAAGLDGMAVVTADLHSALPAIVAGIIATRPQSRVAYVMTDGGALPVWFSQTVHQLADLLAGVVTVGQAFGGDVEATNVHAGLLAARHQLGADVAVVTQGPGNLGTATAWDFSGTAVGEAVNAAAILGGRPVGSLRISATDPRPRHRGVSHHSLTAYGRVALAAADLVVPADLPADLTDQVRGALAPLCPPHRVVTIATHGLDTALRALPVSLSTMGRGLADDYAYFIAAAAAGRHAAALTGTDHRP